MRGVWAEMNILISYFNWDINTGLVDSVAKQSKTDNTQRNHTIAENREKKPEMAAFPKVVCALLAVAMVMFLVAEVAEAHPDPGYYGYYAKYGKDYYGKYGYGHKGGYKSGHHGGYKSGYYKYY